MKARREIILCGGVVNSPQLFQLLGIGDPTHLKNIGVEFGYSLPRVGQNLRNHSASRFTCRVRNVKTFNERTWGLAFVNEAVKWALGNPSVLSLPATACYAFAKSSPVIETSDLQITFMPASYTEEVQSQLDERPGMNLMAWRNVPKALPMFARGLPSLSNHRKSNCAIYLHILIRMFSLRVCPLFGN